MSKRGHPRVPFLLNGTGQTVSYTGTAGTVSNAVDAECTKIWVWTTTDAYIATGSAPTATTSDAPIPGNTPVLVRIQGGHKVSAVQISTGGDLYMCEASD